MSVGKMWMNVVVVVLGDKVHVFQSKMDIHLMDFGLPSKQSYWKIFASAALAYHGGMSSFSIALSSISSRCFSSPTSLASAASRLARRLSCILFITFSIFSDLEIFVFFVDGPSVLVGVHERLEVPASPRQLDMNLAMKRVHYNLNSMVLHRQ